MTTRRHCAPWSVPTNLLTYYTYSRFVISASAGAVHNNHFNHTPGQMNECTDMEKRREIRNQLKVIKEQNKVLLDKRLQELEESRGERIKEKLSDRAERSELYQKAGEDNVKANRELTSEGAAAEPEAAPAKKKLSPSEIKQHILDWAVAKTKDYKVTFAKCFFGSDA